MYTVKRLVSSQAPLVLEHLKRLDAQSVYDRFCVAANFEFLDRYVKQINFDDSGIFGVFDENIQLIGLGECVMYQDKPSEAEVAFSIESFHQGKGLGNRLMKKLIQFAKAHNIEQLNMYCLRSNSKSLHLARKYGLKLTHERDEVSTQIALPKSPPYVQQSFEIADEIIANLEIVHKNNSKLWKLGNSYSDFFKASFRYKEKDKAHH